MLFKKAMNSKKHIEELKYLMLQTASLCTVLERQHFQQYPSVKERFVVIAHIALRNFPLYKELDSQTIRILVGEITDNPEFRGNVAAMLGRLTASLMGWILLSRGVDASDDRINKEIAHEMRKRFVFFSKIMRQCERGDIDSAFERQVDEYISQQLDVHN